jgi:hypothetical protein
MLAERHPNFDVHYVSLLARTKDFAMRRYSLVFLVMLTLAASTASAVSLNPRGIGQVLIYPYYTVNRGQDTLISFANASATAKLVRVRFLEGYNGRSALAFYVFLSAHDVWTAAITQTADDGGAHLISSDRSCTYPALPVGGVDFMSVDYDGSSNDNGPQSITRSKSSKPAIFVRAARRKWRSRRYRPACRAPARRAAISRWNLVRSRLRSRISPRRPQASTAAPRSWTCCTVRSSRTSRRR